MVTSVYMAKIKVSSTCHPHSSPSFFPSTLPTRPQPHDGDWHASATAMLRRGAGEVLGGEEGRPMGIRWATTAEIRLPIASRRSSTIVVMARPAV